MKSTGIVRPVDTLDRIVIPKELCNTLCIEPKEPLEIFVDGAFIVLQKHPENTIKTAKGNLGIVRKVDPVGRVVLPKEICKKLNIAPKDALEIFVEGTKIMLCKYEPARACIFCGEVQDTVSFEGKLVCQKCIKSISKLLEG